MDLGAAHRKFQASRLSRGFPDKESRVSVIDDPYLVKRVGMVPTYQQEWHREQKPSSLDEGFFCWGETNEHQT